MKGNLPSLCFLIALLVFPANILEAEDNLNSTTRDLYEIFLKIHFGMEKPFRESKCSEGDCVNGRGIRVFSCGIKEQGNFAEGHFVEGERTSPNGKKEIGKFNTVAFGGIEIAFLVEGKRIYSDGLTEEGNFSGFEFIEGTRTYPDGTREVGKFHYDLIEGKRFNSDGTTEERKYEPPRIERGLVNESGIWQDDNSVPSWEFKRR